MQAPEVDNCRSTLNSAGVVALALLAAGAVAGFGGSGSSGASPESSATTTLRLKSVNLQDPCSAGAWTKDLTRDSKKVEAAAYVVRVDLGLPTALHEFRRTCRGAQWCNPFSAYSATAGELQAQRGSGCKPHGSPRGVIRRRLQEAEDDGGESVRGPGRVANPGAMRLFASLQTS